MIRLQFIIPLALALFVAPEALAQPAEAPTGIVVAVQGDEVTIELDGTQEPHPGDAVELSLEHPTLGAIVAGTWSVLEIDGRQIIARLSAATGPAQVGMRALFLTEDPPGGDSGRAPDPIATDADIALLEAASIGELRAVRAALAAGANPDVGDEGISALGVAVQNEAIAVVAELLAAGASPDAGAGGFTALALAARAGRSDLVRLLLQAGADPGLHSGDASGRCSGYTPLHFAALENRVDTMRLLIDAGAPIDATSQAEVGTPLSAAALRGHLDAVRLLVDSGASLEPVAGVGFSAFVVAPAANAANIAIMGYLHAAGSDIDGRISAGMAPPRFTGGTALLVAVASENPTALAYLLHAGADPSLRTDAGLLARDFSEEASHLALLDDPVAVENTLVEAMANAASNAEDPVSAATIEALLAIGIDPNAVIPSAGATALFLAEETGNAAAARVLRAYGGRLDPPNKP